MLDPFNDERKYMTWTFILIVFLLITGVAGANENGDLSGKVYPVSKVNVSKVEDILDRIDQVNNDTAVYHQKIRPLDPEETGGQYCFIKVIIKQKGDTIIKEEVMECADGRKKFDGPSYWELFAMFYYHDINNPNYCRKYSRPTHAFKSYGEMCLKSNGKWEVK